jgi:sialidase-1
MLPTYRLSLALLVAVLGTTTLDTTALADDPVFEQQVLFRSGDGGYGGFRIPCVLATNTPNTVLVFCEARQAKAGFGIPFPDQAETEIVMRRSDDGGRKWSDYEVVIESAGVTTGNPCTLLDRETGAVFLAFCRGAADGVINKSAHVVKSTDDGRTWSEPIEITNAAKADDWTYVFTGPGHGIQLQSGRLVIPCSAQYGPQFSYVIYSDDHGVSWQRGERVVGEGTLDDSVKWKELGDSMPDYAPNNVSDEPGIVELSDGRVYMNARSRLQMGHRAYAYSNDGGVTWSKMKFHPDLPESVVDGSLARLPVPNVLLVSRPTFEYEKGMQYGGMWSHRRDLTVSISSDNGKTWPISKLIHQGPAAYSDLTVLPSGDVLCLYECGQEFRYETLTLARFNLEWVQSE